MDYGNEECVPINFVCELPQHLRKLPKQVSKCTCSISICICGRRLSVIWLVLSHHMRMALKDSGAVRQR